MPSLNQIYLETLGAALVALIGVMAGFYFSRLSGRRWLIGFYLPLLLIIILAIPSFFPELSFTAPFSWLTGGRKIYLFINIFTAWILVTPLSRLPRKTTRILVIFFIVAVVGATSVLAFLSPAFVRQELLNLKLTSIDQDGVCLQMTDYNCGPAASVTVLRQLGISAEERDLALWSLTSLSLGTVPNILAETLQKHYPQLKATYRYIENVEGLKSIEHAIIVTQFSFFTDHYVALIKADDKEIIIGDPLRGKVTLTHQEFSNLWRHSAIVIERR